MSMPCSCSIVFLVISGLAWPSNGKVFMARQEEVEASLLAELAGTMRPCDSLDRVVSLEDALRPMHAAVPQDTDGHLSEVVVRYVLHRFFAQRGWFIRGLEPGSRIGNRSSSNPQALHEWVPSHLTGLLSKMSAGRGISLRELAIIAATMEDLVHKETVARLGQVFDALELPRNVNLAQDQVGAVLKIFMMVYAIGGDLDTETEDSPEAVMASYDVFAVAMDDWDAKLEWMQRLRESVHPGASGLNFNAIGRIAEEIGAKYSEYNNRNCVAMKDVLLLEESQTAGRVRLSDFYRKGLGGSFQFTEKIEYLRASGVLDESDPKQPHVIIPNYLGYRGNCIEQSSFYLLCCTDQCEGLMAKLENAIASEMALPEQIIHLVSALSSDTVTAPRTLSPTLTGRLFSIAKSNSGQVPLHGRLFAQWMHHAFPRECAFPHGAGSMSPQTPDEWLQESGHEAADSSVEDMQVHIDADTNQKPKGAEAMKHQNLVENQLQWSEAEEPRLPFGHSARSQPRSTLSAGGVFTMLVFMVYGLILAAKVLLAGTGKEKCFPNLAYGSINFAKEARYLV